jgi:clorobiocin biosynthesis protein CloN6
VVESPQLGEDQKKGRGTIEADLILLHAPSVYDFRERDDILFAYLSDSDSVNVTSIYKMYPLGFFSIAQHLRERGKKVEIINLAALMLLHPSLNIDALLARLRAPVFGIDLHWMCHCHGSIEIATRLKAIHPDCTVIFGGISATYYAQELARYPSVDVAVKGYDTLAPVDMLVGEVMRGSRDFSKIPNLVYKDAKGELRATDFSYKPMLNYNDAPTDWSWYAKVRGTVKTSRAIMTLPNTGCAYDCPGAAAPAMPIATLWESRGRWLRRIPNTSMRNCAAWVKPQRLRPSTRCNATPRPRRECTSFWTLSASLVTGASFSSNSI